MQPPAQELVARDLHDTVWTFRHIYRGRFRFWVYLQAFYHGYKKNIWKPKEKVPI